LVQPSFVAPPVLTVGTAQFTHGKEIAVNVAAQPQWSGPLQKLNPGDAVLPGAVLLISVGQDISAFRAQVGALVERHPTAILVEDTPALHAVFDRVGSRPIRLPQ